MSARKVVWNACLALLLSMIVACGDDDPVTPLDTTPPATVTDLGVPSSTDSSVTLIWTAPGDDGTSASAAQYDIRYSTSVIINANFDSATPVADLPVPSKVGTGQTFTITGFAEKTTYYFALKASDEVPNWSGLSNVVNATTSPEGVPPATVTDLASPSNTDSTATLTWTAPGDDGTSGIATQYDIRYSTSVITEANFDSATPAVNLPASSIAGTGETFTVTDLTATKTYYFSLKTADDSPNWSELSNVVNATMQLEAVPPADVTDLASSSNTDSTATLTWTAPGDDGTNGTAIWYDIRYSTSVITDVNFSFATQAANLPVPSTPGTGETFTVTGLTGNTTYYFAIKQPSVRTFAISFRHTTCDRALSELRSP